MRILAFAFFICAWPACAVGQGVPGTYDLKICRGPCDVKGNEYLTGTVTLLPVAMRDRKGQPVKVGSEFVNGCYALSRGRPQTDSHAGLQPKGYLAWNYRFSDSGLTFALYKTEDASYDVELKPAANGFAGIGVSRGARMPKVGAPRDTVIAVRRKSPEPPACPPVAASAKKP